MGLILHNAPAQLEGELRLPGSKSSSNRWLIIEALSGHKWDITGLSTADDTRVLQQALSSVENNINVGAAGTAMRFMTAYLAQKPGKYLLTGEDRAHDRPIGILVDALCHLGAEIDYLEKTGYPPLQISGKKLNGGIVQINAGVSSQYITALLLIGSGLEAGLTLQWQGELSSAPYVEQTLSVLQQCGIDFRHREGEITVIPGNIRQVPVEIEPDWSAAGYWMAFGSLLPTKMRLSGLLETSLQADKKGLSILSDFGLEHQFDAQGLFISREAHVKMPKTQLWDFRNCPDLAPTLIVLCAALGRKGVFTGLKSLRIKECDRLLALQTELLKFGALLHITEDAAVLISGCDTPKEAIIAIDSWQDHRIVMAMSLLVAVGYRISVNDPEVVSKSYPAFWEDLAKFGFQLENQDGR